MSKEPQYRKLITNTTQMYEVYPEMKLRDQEKQWAPYKVYHVCIEDLKSGKQIEQIFLIEGSKKIIMIDYYFCT